MGIETVASRLTTLVLTADQLRQRGVEVPATVWSSIRSAMTQFSVLVLNMMPAHEAGDLDVAKAGRALLRELYAPKSEITGFWDERAHYINRAADRLRKALDHMEGIAP